MATEVSLLATEGAPGHGRSPGPWKEPWAMVEGWVPISPSEKRTLCFLESPCHPSMGKEPTTLLWEPYAPEAGFLPHHS